MDTSLIRKKIIEDEENEEEELSVDLPGTAESTFCCGGGIHRSASKDQVSFLCMSLVVNLITWFFVTHPGLAMKNF